MSKFIPGVTQLLGGSAENAFDNLRYKSVLQNAVYRIKDNPAEEGYRACRSYLDLMVERSVIDNYSLNYDLAHDTISFCIQWHDRPSTTRTIECNSEH